MSQKISLEEYIRVEATKMGFDLVRIVDAQVLEKEQDFYKEWLKKDYGADMEYLKKDPDKRGNPEKIFPGTRSIICLGMNYFPADGNKSALRTTSQASQKPFFHVARYARTRDYHKVIGKKLKKLCQMIDEKCGSSQDAGQDVRQKISHSVIDTAPVFDRSFAEKSGLGFIGKNSCLITRELGSYIFLAEIFVTTQLKSDEPSKWKGACGSCTRCVDICPTNAILPDRTIDARRCISYLTIENRGEIPEEFREKVGTWLFGCDLCQEICPHNVRSKPTKVDDFQNIRIGTQVHDLQKILEIKTDEEFLKAFAGTPLMRAKRRGLIRNACIVAGNLREKSLLPSLKKIAAEKDEMLAQHAQWAIRHSEKPKALKSLPPLSPLPNS